MRLMMLLTLTIAVLILTSCSEVLLLSSIGGTVVSQSPAIKAYNGVDALTIMNTKKDIKKHAYDKIKKLDRDRGTNLATGISLDLSDDGQPSDDSRREGGAF